MMRLKALSITAAILILSGCSTLTMSGIGGSENSDALMPGTVTILIVNL